MNGGLSVSSPCAEGKGKGAAVPGSGRRTYGPFPTLAPDQAGLCGAVSYPDQRCCRVRSQGRERPARTSRLCRDQTTVVTGIRLYGRSARGDHNIQ
jgi:hypothetical protein